MARDQPIHEAARDLPLLTHADVLVRGSGELPRWPRDERSDRALARVLRRADRQTPQPDAIAISGHWTKYGAVYAIPYRCLVSNESENLLVTGRCISVDHQTHDATKEIPPALATGEAAGVAAGLALAGGGRAGEVETGALQAALRARGALVDYAF